MSGDEPTPDHVVTVDEIHQDLEAVVFSGFAPEAIFAEAGAWLSAQRRLSTGWAVADTDWFLTATLAGPDVGRMRCYLTLAIARDAEDGITGDIDEHGQYVRGTGTREKMIDRLPWPPTT